MGKYKKITMCEITNSKTKNNENKRKKELKQTINYFHFRYCSIGKTSSSSSIWWNSVQR
jgi:hypothetical protein